ncbi:hypothetical protein [Clostridium sp. JS66]|uniref:hypothetical protein n=1 Tax=Clostridium sp. JS66 TaxID=3064705 RepID=UPI00298DE613|nr:hypothetical protein [Clostridium sp. JS66]WPC41214.1 hypothetical protein Q6H37_25495 [Clostridium sp. JS66]
MPVYKSSQLNSGVAVDITALQEHQIGISSINSSSPITLLNVDGKGALEEVIIVSNIGSYTSSITNFGIKITADGIDILNLLTENISSNNDIEVTYGIIDLKNASASTNYVSICSGYGGHAYDMMEQGLVFPSSLEQSATIRSSSDICASAVAIINEPIYFKQSLTIQISGALSQPNGNSIKAWVKARY